MTNEKILTDDAIHNLIVDFEIECDCGIETYPVDNIVPFARAIEQAAIKADRQQRGIQAFRDVILSDKDLLDVYRSLDNPKRDRDSVIEAMSAAVEAYKEKLAEQVQALKRDKERLDWLADIENSIGNVQLPRVCVERNPHSLRDAIDDAMEHEK